MKEIRIDLLKLLKRHTSGWVAISSDFKKVVAVGRTLNEARSKTKKNRGVYYFPAAKSYAGFVGAKIK